MLSRRGIFSAFATVPFAGAAIKEAIASPVPVAPPTVMPLPCDPFVTGHNQALAAGFVLNSVDYFRVIDEHVRRAPF